MDWLSVAAAPIPGDIYFYILSITDGLCVHFLVKMLEPQVQKQMVLQKKLSISCAF